MPSRILGTGSYVPVRCVQNRDLHQFPESVLPLIAAKTGIKARHYAADNEFTSDLAAKAAECCLQKAGFDTRHLDAIILATSSPDRMQPATATRVQSLIGAENAFAFDVNSVCSGAIFALEAASSFIENGAVDNALVIAAEVYSRILNPSDFSTAPYFGDGAGAILLERGAGKPAILRTILKTDGSGHDVIQIPAGGSMLPYGRMNDTRQQFFTMLGKDVYKFAVAKGSEIIQELMAELNVGSDRVSFVVPHQANINIINAISEATGIAIGKFATTLEKYGNTAAASVLLTFDELCRSGKIADGDLALIVAFGGGLSWAATAIQF